MRKTLLVGLIKSKAFEEALQLIKSQKSLDFSFEHAYILHRTGQNLQALKILNSMTQSENHIMQLKAQVLYKLASYQEAVDAYEKVYNSKCYDESEIGDIITNLLACSAN